MEDSLLQKLKKIKTLVERGHKSEALEAKRKLDILLAKYNLSESDLEETETKRITFKYSFKHEKDIILQCLSKIKNDPNLSYYKMKGRKEVKVDLTIWEEAEANEMIKFHLRELKKHLNKQIENLTLAYISKQHIFADKKDDSEPSEMPSEKVSEILNALRTLDDVKPYLKQLS